MHKNKKVRFVSISVFILAVIVVVLFVWNTWQTPTPVSAMLGQTFELRSGQTAQIVGTKLEVKIKEFFYSGPCPQNMQCITDGNAVKLEYRFNGQVLDDRKGRAWAHLRELGYLVEVIHTDYKTVANIVVSKTE